MNDFERLGVYIDADGYCAFACIACLRELADLQAFDALPLPVQQRMVNRLRTWERADGRCQLCEVTYGPTPAHGAGRKRGPSPWATTSV